MGFDEPDSGGFGTRIMPRDVLGHLLMVWATDYIAHSPTRHTQKDKPSDVVVVDVVDLDQLDDDGHPGLLSTKTWWRQTRLIMALKKRVGNPTPILARMGQGKATQGLPPFELVSATTDPDAVTRANAWLAAHPTFKPSLPDDHSAASDGLGASEAAINGTQQPHWGQPAAQPEWSRPPAPAPVTPNQVVAPALPPASILERLARQSLENQQHSEQWGNNPLPPPQPQGETPGY